MLYIIILIFYNVRKEVLLVKFVHVKTLKQHAKTPIVNKIWRFPMH